MTAATCFLSRDLGSGIGFRAHARRFAWFASLLVWFGAQAHAESFAESHLFGAAAHALEDGLYDRAEKEFGEFIRLFPASARLTEARVLQAQSHGQAQLAQGDYSAAAGTFASIMANFPASPRRIDACLGQASAFLKLGRLRPVVELLTRPDGAFLQGAAGTANDESRSRGFLLLAEASIGLEDYPSVEQALKHLEGHQLPPALNWQRLFLSARLQVARGQFTTALNTTTNLLAVASQIGSRAYRIESALLQGQILESLAQFGPAVQSYEKASGADVTVDRQRLSLLKIIELTLAQGKTKEAMQRLESFLTQFQDGAGLDWAHFTLGELRLKEYYASVGAPIKPDAALPTLTNGLHEAELQFTLVITNFPKSLLVGKANLNRGWCLWEEAQGKTDPAGLAESLSAFKAASARLPKSEDQAVAVFKWADCQFQQGDFPGAIRNYQRVLDGYEDIPRIKASLFDQALYQIVRAGIKLSDLEVAKTALNKLLNGYPQSYFGERTLLLVGQALNRPGTLNEARELFAKFAERFPGSSLLPDAQLAVARTYALEGDWSGAISSYEHWLADFPQHPSHPQAEYDYAWANYLAGNETKALALYTNLVTRLPATNSLAPLAQNWVADYYLNHNDYTSAEGLYQNLFLNTNAPPGLAYEARLAAGHAAFNRYSFKDAEVYFKNLIDLLLKDTNSPPDLLARAWFFLGDTSFAKPPDLARPSDKFSEAITAFSKVDPTNRLAPHAWGQIASCYLQLGAQNPENYKTAAETFKKVVDSAIADAATRSLAEIGLATVLEKQALLNKPEAERSQLIGAALDHYLNIVYERNLRSGERSYPFALKEAGLAAEKLVEAKQQWAVAVNLYRRLEELLPALHASLELKLAQAQAQLQKN